MIGWWVCRWSDSRDENDVRSVEFAQIIEPHPLLPGRYTVEIMGTKERCSWHRATILRKWMDRSDAKAAWLAVRAIEMTAEKGIADPRSRERIRDSVIVDILTGGLI